MSPAERPLADLVDREVAEPGSRGIVAQPSAHAACTRDVADHALELVTIEKRNAPGLLDRGEEPLVLKRELGLAAGCWHLDPSFARAVQDRAAVAALEIVKRRVDV